jgi:lipid-binding SYLF domain-containing protein
MKLFWIFILLAFPLTTSHAGWNPFGGYKRSGEENVQLFISKLKEKDPEIQKFFDESVGWAVFPKISKAGIGVGGAYGNGRVYRKGNVFIGTSRLTQLSMGFQLGGQIYGEIIFFQSNATLEKFKSGKFEFGARVSAIAVDKGSAKEAGFQDGTAVFSMPLKGLMYEATLSGQSFTFKGK